jgi:acyl-coenzyme A synthetase/AMP-(fatty) acid ligase
MAATSLSYADLDTRANQLANKLLSVVTQKRAQVALTWTALPTPSLRCSAILKIGSPYVPIAADLPAPRLAQRIAEGGIRAVVTIGALVGNVAGRRANDLSRSRCGVARRRERCEARTSSSSRMRSRTS